MLTFTDLTPAGITTPPSLSFDFTTRVNRVGLKKTPFADALTFTRASPKWVFDGTGTLVEVPVDTPAYDHDPVTGEPLGVLIEESRTNVLDNSSALDTSFWAAAGCGLTVLTNQFSGFNAFEATVTDATVNAFVTRGGILVGDNIDHASSVFIKKGLYRYVGLRMRSFSHTYVTTIDTETLSTFPDPDGYGLDSIQVFDLGDWIFAKGHVNGHGWDNKSFYIDFRDATGGAVPVALGSKIVFALPQWENGTKEVSSTIPTTTGAVTRAADNMSRTLGAEFNGQEGTWFLDAFLRCKAATNRYILTSGGDQRVIYINATETNLTITAYSQETGAHYSLGGAPNNSRVKIAVRINSSGELQGAVNGTSGVIHQGAGYLLETPSMQVFYHKDTGHNARGVSYYPYAMTAAELEALTAP